MLHSYKNSKYTLTPSHFINTDNPHPPLIVQFFIGIYLFVCIKYSPKLGLLQVQPQSLTDPAHTQQRIMFASVDDFTKDQEKTCKTTVVKNENSTKEKWSNTESIRICT